MACFTDWDTYSVLIFIVNYSEILFHVYYVFVAHICAYKFNFQNIQLGLITYLAEEFDALPMSVRLVHVLWS